MYRCVLLSLFTACSSPSGVLMPPVQPTSIEVSSHSWAWMDLGDHIGTEGLHPVDAGGRHFLVTTAQENTSWALLKDDGHEGLAHVWASFPSDLQIRALAVGNLAPNPGDEVAVAWEDGRIELWSAHSRTLLDSVSTFETQIRDLALADLDHDGFDEILVAHASAHRAGDLVVYRADGTEIARHPDGGGHRILVANLDDDPAMEAANSAGRVLDLTSGTVQWNGTFSHAPETVLATADTNSDGRQELLVGHPEGRVAAYDVQQQQQPVWTIPAHATSLTVADADADGTAELIVGRATGLAAKAYALGDRSVLWEVASDYLGSDALTVADLDGDQQPELYWSAGATTSVPDRLHRGQPHRGRWTWRSPHIPDRLHGPVLADLNGDGEPEITVVAKSAMAAPLTLFVFDGRSKALITSVEVMQSVLWSQTARPVARDLDGDGRDELVLAGEVDHRGVVEIWRLDAEETLTLQRSSSHGRPGGWNAAAVVDLLADGSLDIIVGGEAGGVHALDTDGRIQWTSPALIGGIRTLETARLDGRAGAEIVALDDQGDVWILDSHTGEVDVIIEGPWVDVEFLSQPVPALLLAGAQGELSVWRHRRRYVEVDRHTLPEVGAVTGISQPFQGVVMVAHDGMATALQVPGLDPLWSTAAGVEGLGEDTAFLPTTGEMLLNGTTGVFAFRP